MKSITINAFEFNELSTSAKDRIRYRMAEWIGYDYSIMDELQEVPFKIYINELLGDYQESSQGPYWKRGVIRTLFSKFMNDNIGNIKRLLSMPYDDRHPVERAFFADCKDFYEGIQWDQYSGLYNDKHGFYARNTLRAIYDCYAEHSAWVSSDEYIQDFCEANDIFFTEQGQEVRG